jgi:hypothetical protein
LGKFAPIGRLLSLGIFLIIKGDPNFWFSISADEKLSIHFDKIVGWATLWAIFLQTHLVTLVADSFQGLAPFSWVSRANLEQFSFPLILVPPFL